MSSVPASPSLAARNKVLSVFVRQGAAGLAVMLWLTVARGDETLHIIQSLGAADSAILALIFFLFCTALAMTRFALTDLIFVSLVIVGCVTMFPLLGPVLSSWIALAATFTARLLAIAQIGPVTISMADPGLEHAKTFGLFGTYGLPVVAGSLVYELAGGSFPVADPTSANALRITLGGVVLVITNNLVMARVERAYGYSRMKSVQLGVVDASIYLVCFPFAICMTFAYTIIGWPIVLALAASGVVANVVARSLAVTRGATQQQLQRLASISTVGETTSLNVTTDELLATIYTECKKVVDVSLFSIALYDEERQELSFELDIRNDRVMPKERLPIGIGLNSWVVQRNEPLLLGSVEEERAMGLESVDDASATESWLGVPMIARERVVGVISIQSYRKRAFSHDDVLLLTAIANQAAVAIENAQLYRELESMTLALEQRVQDRTRELWEANLRLMAADRSKNQFLANMSHELRTPLNSIIGFSSVLLDHTRETLPPRLHKFVGNMLGAGTHLLALINDILDLAKIEAGKMMLEPQTFDIRDTINSVVDSLTPAALQKQVTIAVNVDEDVPQLYLDEQRVRQVIMNLLSNAVKFSRPDDSVDVRVRLVADTPLNVHGGALQIEIEDRGIGIREEELGRIFEEFYQTEEGRRVSRGGTGLGLSLTRSFVERHGGTISVESAPGGGSRFSVLLPLRMPAARERVEAPLTTDQHVAGSPS